MTLRFRRSLYSAAMGVVVVVGVSTLYFLWLFSFTTANGTTYQGILGVASQLRDDGHGGGRLSGVNPVALGLTLFLTAVSAVLVAYTVVLLGVKLILSLKGPADEQKVETGRRKAYPAWLVNSLAAIYGALLVHPVVFLVAFAYGTLFGVPPVARASAGAPTTSGLEGGGETANFLGIWYVISLGILPVVASGIGAAVAIGVSYLLIHKGQKDFRNRSADS